MKNMIKLPVVILGLMLLLTGISQKTMAQDDDISLQTFYDELAPYGTWMQDPDYGNVWRPDVDQNDFRPYYNDGRWVMTEYGNTWVSDYDWGWAPFHYGRWITNRYNQWVWIPDTVWGPAWVSWRSGGGYYGWAPLGPGFNISINFGGGGYRTPNDWWVFIPQRNIYSQRYSRYANRNVTIINQTTIINNTYGGRSRNTYYTGPGASDIRRATRRDVTVYNISRSTSPGRSSIANNNVSIYRPYGGNRSDNNRGSNNSGGRNGQANGNNYGRGSMQGQNPVISGNSGRNDYGGRNGAVTTAPNRDGRGGGRSTTPVTGNPQVQPPVNNGNYGGRNNGGVMESPSRDGRGGRSTSPVTGTPQVQPPVNNGTPVTAPLPVTNGSVGRDGGREQRQQIQQQQAQQQRDQQNQQRQQQQAEQQRQQQQVQQQRDQQNQQRQQQQAEQQRQQQQQAQQQRDQQNQQRQQQQAEQQRQQQQQAQQQRDQQNQQRQQQQAEQQRQQQQQAQQQRQQQQAEQQRQQQAQQQQQRQQAEQQRQQQRQQEQQRSTENSGEGRGGRN